MGEYCIAVGRLKLLTRKVAPCFNWRDLLCLGGRPNYFSLFPLFPCPACLRGVHCHTIINLSEFNSYKQIGWGLENNSENCRGQRKEGLYTCPTSEKLINKDHWFLHSLHFHHCQGSYYLGTVCTKGSSAFTHNGEQLPSRCDHFPPWSRNSKCQVSLNGMYL